MTQKRKCGGEEYGWLECHSPLPSPRLEEAEADSSPSEGMKLLTLGGLGSVQVIKYFQGHFYFQGPPTVYKIELGNSSKSSGQICAQGRSTPLLFIFIHRNQQKQVSHGALPTKQLEHAASTPQIQDS